MKCAGIDAQVPKCWRRLPWRHPGLWPQHILGADPAGLRGAGSARVKLLAQAREHPPGQEVLEVLGELKGCSWVQFVGNAGEVKVSSQGKERGRRRSREAATVPGRKGKGNLRAVMSWDPQEARALLVTFSWRRGQKKLSSGTSEAFPWHSLGDVSDVLLKCSGVRLHSYLQKVVLDYP